MSSKWIISLDVGGTNIKLALVDSHGNVQLRKRRRTKVPSSADEICENLALTISSFLRSLPRDVKHPQIAIGFAGLTDGERGIVRYAPNIARLSEIDLKMSLERRLGLKVLVDNDANCAALGEWWKGSAAGTRTAFMFTLGTGIGGGFVIDGDIYRGAHGIASEIGHTIIDPDGPECACGKRGCLESLASATAIVRTYVKEAMIPKKSMGSITAKEVVRRARLGDSKASDAVRKAGEALGVGIANIFAVLDPEIIVIGGGVSRAGRLLLAPASQKAKELVPDVVRSQLKVCLSSLGDDAGVIGAAYLWIKQMGRSEG